MMDETAGAGEQPGATTEQSAGQTEAGKRVAFCQQCGRELTNETVRRAGAAVYCEPCLVARLEGQVGGGGTTGAAGAANASGWTPVGSTGATQSAGAPGATSSTYAGGSAPMGISGEPSPWLAALLGLIPGVGAMYNGQYAKGVAHLVIFVVLDSLQHSVNDIFGVFVIGWVFYQVFDAYHTAKARRYGTPLPNPFGLNDIGDRMGFGKNWPGSVSRPVTTASPGGWPPSAGTTAAPPHETPNWAGYVPPTNFGATAPPPPSAPVASAADAAQASGGVRATWTAPLSPAYGATYTGEPWQTPGSVPASPMSTATVPPPGRRFPVGAAWLIGLGLLFLVANLDPAWRLGPSWIVAILLAALGVWLVFRRVEMLRSVARLSGETDGWGHEGWRKLVCQLRWPVVLLVLAILFALQAMGTRTLGQTWPALLIAFGALLLLERSLGQRTWYPAAGVTARGAADTSRAAWTSEGEPRKDGR